MENLFNESDFVFFKDLVIRAGMLARDIQNDRLEITRKADTSIVTQADLAVQELLIDSISRRYENFNFIHEEEFDRSKVNISDDTISVIIDPIDGTAMFSMHLPIWCVSVGIFRGYTPLYGFVYSPGSSMLFYNDDENSYLNDEIVTVDKNLMVNPETNIFYASEVQRIYKMDFPGKIRNLGSTALHACLTTDNRRNRLLAFVGQAFLWDWAGAIPIILRAGGNLRYINGDEVDYKKIVHNNYALPNYLIAYNCNDFESVQKVFKKL